MRPYSFVRYADGAPTVLVWVHYWCPHSFVRYTTRALIVLCGTLLVPSQSWCGTLLVPSQFCAVHYLFPHSFVWYKAQAKPKFLAGLMISTFGDIFS